MPKLLIKELCVSPLLCTSQHIIHFNSSTLSGILLALRVADSTVACGLVTYTARLYRAFKGYYSVLVKGSGTFFVDPHPTP